jgi:hypothetical protein
MRSGFVALNGIAYGEMKRLWKEIILRHNPNIHVVLECMKCLMQDSWSPALKLKPSISQTENMSVNHCLNV